MPYVCAKSKHAEPQRMKADSQNVFTFAGSPQLADINLIKKGLTVLGSSGRKKTPTRCKILHNPAQFCTSRPRREPSSFNPDLPPGAGFYRRSSAFIGVYRRPLWFFANPATAKNLMSNDAPRPAAPQLAIIPPCAL